MLAKDKVSLDLNEILSSVFARNDYGKGLDRSVVETLVREGVAIALRLCNHHEEILSYKGGVEIDNGNCGISEKSTTIYIADKGIWTKTIGRVSIDFLSGDIFVIDEKLHLEQNDEIDFHSIIKKKDVKFDHEIYGIKYKKPIDTTIISSYVDESKRDVRLYVCNFTEKDRIKELLLNKEVKMYNKENKYKGELTILNKKDVENIILDRPKIYLDEKEENVIIAYPYNICRMVRKIK